MKRRRRRLNWVRVTRDPAVAAAHERSAAASAEWSLALLDALRGQLDSPVPLPSPTGKPVQFALPLGDDPTPS